MKPPCAQINQRAWMDLARAQAAALMLSELGCAIERIEIGRGSPHILLREEPPEGAVAGRQELYRGGGAGRARSRIGRADFFNCVLEWSLA